jgi:hypothetical protein
MPGMAVCARCIVKPACDDALLTFAAIRQKDSHHKRFLLAR